jgi:hypothetical protein
MEPFQGTGLFSRFPRVREARPPALMYNRFAVKND